ncbi:hypothetical protein CEXT_25981, partial [Caerostris extrusa]
NGCQWKAGPKPVENAAKRGGQPCVTLWQREGRTCQQVLTDLMQTFGEK